MTAPTGHVGRRSRALALVAGQADALLVSDRTNVYYLSGFSGSAGSLLLTAAGAVLVTDGRYGEQAGRECPGVEVVLDRSPDGGALRRAVADGAHRVAVEADCLTWAAHTALSGAVGADRLVATRGLVEQVRRSKDDDEVELLATACRMTEEALGGVLEWIRPGHTERQIAVRLERAMVDLGADAPAFDSIVAAGVNSALPHHRPGAAALRAGDLLKIDCGARFRGYHADLTRMFVIGAEPDSRQSEVHAAVAAAAAAARALVAPGVAVTVVDAAARRELGEWEPRFTHGLGHGVGLQIHEAPLLAARSADTMVRADVLTVEPGVYEPGFGGVRIEDTLLVTDAGARCLTTMTRDLIRLA